MRVACLECESSSLIACWDECYCVCGRLVGDCVVAWCLWARAHARLGSCSGSKTLTPHPAPRYTMLESAMFSMHDVTAVDIPRKEFDGVSAKDMKKEVGLSGCSFVMCSRDDASSVCRSSWYDTKAITGMKPTTCLRSWPLQSSARKSRTHSPLTPSQVGTDLVQFMFRFKRR